MEDNHATQYFYHFIEIRRESAMDQLAALTAKLREDNIYEAVKSRTVAIVTDGASGLNFHIFSCSQPLSSKAILIFSYDW